MQIGISGRRVQGEWPLTFGDGEWRVLDKVDGSSTFGVVSRKPSQRRDLQPRYMSGNDNQEHV